MGPAGEPGGGASELASAPRGTRPVLIDQRAPLADRLREAHLDVEPARGLDQLVEELLVIHAHAPAVR